MMQYCTKVIVNAERQVEASFSTMKIRKWDMKTRCAHDANVPIFGCGGLAGFVRVVAGVFAATGWVLCCDAV